MKKIAFRLNSDKAVEYANAHKSEFLSDSSGFKNGWFYMKDGRGVRQTLVHVPRDYDYTDVTENFERGYWGPWKDMLDNCKLGEKCTCIKQTYTGCYNYALNKNEKIHIPLKNIDGHITVSKTASPEVIEALNKMAELAYQSLTPKQ